jgi:hypothetical protein
MQPGILLESLESVRRRVRLLAVAFGAGLVLTVVVGLLVASVAADYLLNLPAIPRLALVLAAAGTVACGTWRWLVKPLLARLTLNDVAGRVERTYPQFQDRLRSTVDILTERETGRPVPGSDIMKQRVVSEAARLTQSLDLSRVVVARPVWYSSTGALGAIGLLVLLAMAVGPQFDQLALARLFTPFASNPWPKSVEIEAANAVPDRVTVGQRVDVDVRLTRGDRSSRRATIFYCYGDADGRFGPVQQEYMTRGDDGVYHAALDAKVPESLAGTAAATGLMKIWTESGDGRLDVAPVRVVQRLTIERVEAVVTPPPYAALPPVRMDLASNPAAMTVGSAVRLTATFSKPLATDQPVTAELLGAGGSGAAEALRWTATSPTTAVATFTAATSIRFHLHATDTDGLHNAAAEEFELVVRPDQNPSVMIENPRRNEDCTPQAVIPLQAVAEDDFGITSVTLVVDRLGDKKRWEVPLVHDAAATSSAVQWARVDTTAAAGGGDLLRFRANYDFDLGKVTSDLKPGDVLDYYLLAHDNFSLNGATHPAVASGHLRLNIISQDELTNQVTAELQTTADQVATLKRNQADTQRQTSELAKATAGKPQMDDADRAAADRLSGQQGTLASQAKSVANRMAEVQRRLDENRSTNAELKNTAKDVADLLNSAAEGPMKGAAAAVADAKAAPKPDARQQDFKDAQSGQVQSGEQLQKAMDRMGNIGSLSRTIENLRDLLAQQQKLSADTAAAGKATLGQTADQMKPEDKAKLDALAKAQAGLADKTAKALDEMAKDADKLAKSDPSSSAAMKQAASTGQQQNVVPNQAKASQKTGENKQSEAQSAQKQAELGLQMMLADLREAERHKLDELNRKLAELQQQVAVLIRRQSGHNLDTLAALGATFPGGPDAAGKAALFEQAERDPQLPPPTPDLANLSAGQEQTERNTRDVAKAAEDLPDGAAPADHLTDAADQMERAIVHLRAERLAAAYTPPQSRALDALLAAKRVIDEQKKKSDEQQDQQKKEAIRQVFIQIRVAQAAVNARTVVIDGAPRVDGARRREDAMALTPLAGDQGKVADQAAALDERLAGLGSIVYSWANRDIVKHMRDVKDALGQQQTGPVVQARQRQVLDELDAVIADLMVKPEHSQFVQHSGAAQKGGGGKSSPGIPSEAELRLLKDLQVAENTATADIAKAGAHDKGETLELGTREGDLRGLLDKLIQKASQGQLRLPAEPDNRDQLPEEQAAKGGAGPDIGEKIDEQELQNDLIGEGAKAAPKPAAGADAAPGDNKPGQPPATRPARRPGDKPPAPEEGDHELALVGGRMARARQRLAINDDPGPVTQEIQRRILDNLDHLIEEARKKEAQQQNQDPQKGQKGEDMAQAKPGQAQPQPGQPKPGQQKGGTSPAQAATPGGTAGQPGGPDVALQEGRMWGQISPRERNAVSESATEKPLDKYRALVDDYYRAMSTRAKAAGQ